MICILTAFPGFSSRHLFSAWRQSHFHCWKPVLHLPRHKYRLSSQSSSRPPFSLGIFPRHNRERCTDCLKIPPLLHWARSWAICCAQPPNLYVNPTLLHREHKCVTEDTMNICTSSPGCSSRTQFELSGHKYEQRSWSAEPKGRAWSLG